MANKPFIAILLLIITHTVLPHASKAAQSLARSYLTQAQELSKKGNDNAAIETYKKALDNCPDCIDIYIALSALLKKKEQFEESIFYLNQATTYNPHNIVVHFNLGCLYLQTGLFNKALTEFKTVYNYSPQTISALYNIGYTLKNFGNIDEAIKIYRQVLAKKPDHDSTHLALGFAYLINGNFNKGWKQHERYLKQYKKNADKLRLLLRNNNIKGKTIFLFPEGGLGDTLQFIRYAQRLKSMGATIIVASQKSLIPLLSRCPYIDQLLHNKKPSQSFDASSSLMSLPAVFNDNEETFPRTIPYLFSDPELVDHWKKKLSSRSNKLKIGICWEADVHNDVSRLPIARRGISLTHFYCLQTIANIQFYSLQKYDGIEQLKNIPSTFPIFIFDNDFDKKNGSFMDTAAVMEQMDLIISIDSAVAHLAGALGRPVWLLLPYATDWRWINNRTDSPWYPSMRIFKQPAPFDWDSVIQTIHHELEQIEKGMNKKM